MSKLRSLNTIIWSDTWFELLNPEEKLLFIYFVTNEKTNMLGVYEISVRKVSFETGISIPKIESYLKKFEKDGKIKYHSNRVLLLKYLKHQNYNFNMMKSAIRTYNELPIELKNNEFTYLDESKEGFQTLCNGFAGVRKIEDEYEDEIEYEKEDIYVFDFKKELLNLGADENLVNDWIKVRKTKKATNTATALKGFVTELNKSNLNINQVLEKCVTNSWKGFNAEWLDNERKPKETEKKTTFAERVLTGKVNY